MNSVVGWPSRTALRVPLRRSPESFGQRDTLPFEHPTGRAACLVYALQEAACNKISWISDFHLAKALMLFAFNRPLKGTAMIRKSLPVGFSHRIRV